jgi:hypothetical protein
MQNHDQLRAFFGACSPLGVSRYAFAALTRDELDTPRSGADSTIKIHLIGKRKSQKERNVA